MKARPRGLLGALCTLLLASAACSPALPDYAAPHGGLVDPASLDSADLIEYRALTRDDFRGTEPPAHFADVAHRVGATTCAHVRTTPDTQILIRGSSDGSTGFTSSVKRLRFHALMDRGCSWWNEDVAGLSPDYVLEHEQIHFALFEIKARRLNAAVQEISRKMQVTAATQEAAHAQAQQALQDYMQEVADELIEENRKFDEDTSLGYKPERQKAWLARVNADLARTRQWAETSHASTRRTTGSAQ